MKCKLAENIRQARKGLGLTQEQLAEALNVSVGVISKWELGQSTPDLSIILELAELFEVSVDVLLGYQIRDRKREALLKELDEYGRDQEGPIDFSRVEQILLKYPNDFQIVYSCAELYGLRGLRNRDEEKNLRALGLYERAGTLIGQNRAPRISRTSLAVERGRICQTLGRYEEAVAILKENNPLGVNDPQIGYILAAHDGELKEAMGYLSKALLDSLAAQNQVAQGLLNVYERQGRFDRMEETGRWILDVIDSIVPPGRGSYLDKFRGLYLAAIGYAQFRRGLGRQAEETLTAAKAVARRFDETPVCGLSQLRFVELDEAVAYDSLGATAMEALDAFVAEQGNAAFSELWSRNQ